MRRLVAGLVLPLALASCIESGPSELSGPDAAACEARGGYVAVAGFSGEEFCAEPTPDAGQMCRVAQDCTGYCAAESRTCSSHFNAFGCFSYLDATGQIASICVD